MRGIERKAVRLVSEGRVRVDSVLWDGDELVSVGGTVRGDHGEYEVGFLPDGRVFCQCTWGQNRGTSHAHDIALRLAATYERQKEMQE
jgi:hypothetical protein